MSSVFSPVLLVWRGFLTIVGLVFSPLLLFVTLIVTCGMILMPIAGYEGDKENVRQKAQQSSVTAVLYGFYIGSAAILSLIRLCCGRRQKIL